MLPCWSMKECSERRKANRPRCDRRLRPPFAPRVLEFCPAGGGCLCGFMWASLLFSLPPTALHSSTVLRHAHGGANTIPSVAVKQPLSGSVWVLCCCCCARLRRAVLVYFGLFSSANSEVSGLTCWSFPWLLMWISTRRCVHTTGAGEMGAVDAGLLVKIFGTTVVAGVCALFKYSWWMKNFNTYTSCSGCWIRGADMLRHDSCSMCVCMCAVFVFGVDDYQSQAVFRPDLGYASAFLCSGSTPGPEKKPFDE